jgi:Cu/Ag efflux pump CusA
MGFKNFWKENRKGFLWSSVTIILGFPLLHIIQNRVPPSWESFLMAIPFAFIGVFILMCLFGLLMGVKDGN